MNTIIIHNNRIPAKQILDTDRAQIGNRHPAVHHLIDSRNHRHITACVLTNIEYILPVLTRCGRYGIHNLCDIILLNHLRNVISIADNRHTVYEAAKLRRIVIYDTAGLCVQMRAHDKLSDKHPACISCSYNHDLLITVCRASLLQHLLTCPDKSVCKTARCTKCKAEHQSDNPEGIRHLNLIHLMNGNAHNRKYYKCTNNMHKLIDARKTPYTVIQPENIKHHK